MKVVCLLFITVLGISAINYAEDKGNCPAKPLSSPPVGQQRASSHPPKPGEQYAGTAVVAVVVSDTGYVCSSRVIQSFDKKFDEMAIGKIAQWHFSPAKKDGRPVPVAVTVAVDFWRDKDGEIKLDDTTSSKPQPSSEK
jgi:TonB family protein